MVISKPVKKNSSQPDAAERAEAQQIAIRENEIQTMRATCAAFEKETQQLRACVQRMQADHAQQLQEVEDRVRRELAASVSSEPLKTDTVETSVSCSPIPQSLCDASTTPMPLAAITPVKSATNTCSVEFERDLMELRSQLEQAHSVIVQQDKLIHDGAHLSPFVISIAGLTKCCIALVGRLPSWDEVTAATTSATAALTPVRPSGNHVSAPPDTIAKAFRHLSKTSAYKENTLQRDVSSPLASFSMWENDLIAGGTCPLSLAVYADNNVRVASPDTQSLLVSAGIQGQLLR